MQSSDVTATFCATLVDEWVALGVRLAFVAPGSRSTPMALAIASRDQLRTEVFLDERSAAFAALGAGKSSGEPALLLCTSGTAVANFFPAVVEASHGEVPLVVITADRPPELQGVGAPQTIDQQRVFGSFVRSFVDPGVADEETETQWRGVARRVYRAATGERPGPAHLNLPFREPLVGTSSSLPPRDDVSITRSQHRPLGSELLARLTSRITGKRGLIVAGSGGPDRVSLTLLAEHLGWPVLADPLGGARTDDAWCIRHADALLRDAQIAPYLAPDVVLRFGALPASKVVNGWLRDCGADTITVTTGPFLIDPDRRTSLHVVTDSGQLCRDLANTSKRADAQWRARWIACEQAAREHVARLLDNDSELSEPAVARVLVDSMPDGSTIVASSSMPIRDIEWYAAGTSHLTVLSNRGVNGIDGVISTALGVALSSGGPVGLLIGDVAFLHDSGALVGLGQRGVDVRIVVVDNRGGGIFSFLPQRRTLQESTFEALFGTPHQSDITALAAAHGVPSGVVAAATDLRRELGRTGPSVILVRTNRDSNVTTHEMINRAVADAARSTIR